MRATGITIMYYNEFAPSHIKSALALRYLLRKISPFALVAIVFASAWIGQMVVGIASVPVVVTILH